MLLNFCLPRRSWPKVPRNVQRLAERNLGRTGVMWEIVLMTSDDIWWLWYHYGLTMDNYSCHHLQSGQLGCFYDDPGEITTRSWAYDLTMAKVSTYFSVTAIPSRIPTTVFYKVQHLCGSKHYMFLYDFYWFNLESTADSRWGPVESQ